MRRDRLNAVRLARFDDGSSDEDRAEARVGKTLEALRGRSIIHDVQGTPVVDVTIDVATGHLMLLARALRASVIVITRVAIHDGRFGHRDHDSPLARQTDVGELMVRGFGRSRP